MGYTVDEANKELEKIISGERPATKNELRDIIKNLDVTDNYAKKDATTLLYSGLEDTKVKLLEKDRNVRMLNHTEAYKFLNEIQYNETFKDAWEKVTGDGVKERTSWVKSEDAFLVYDKNEDGKIAGINEIFGSRTIEGFSELRDTIDSNYDNKIDRRDVLFNRLQLWYDKNQDGQAQEGELTYLKDAGIDSIDLNAIDTDIKINGHTISQASRYTNSQGEKNLIADIHLAYDSRITTIDPTLIKDFSIDIVQIEREVAWWKIKMMI